MATDGKLVHIKVYLSGVFQAKVGDVWEIVRNYGQAETWLTGPQGVKTFTRLLPGQVNCQIGAVRLVTIGQASFVDQLDALDDDRHVMKYKLISHPLNTNPFPGAFLNFRAVIRLHDVTRGNGTFLEWTGEFDTEPQDCQVMRQAIHERLEAGFQGLEMLFRPSNHAGGRLGGQNRPSQHDTGDVSRGVAGMNLRQSTSMPPTTSSWVQTNRSPRNGPASVASEGAGHPQIRTIHESNSGSSLASSPHHNETFHRPGSGGNTLQQWTSGGSGSTIHLSTLPTRVSGGEQEVRGGGGSRSRSFAGWVADASTAAHLNPGVHLHPAAPINPSAVPSASQVHVPRPSTQAADLFQRYQQGQARQQQQQLQQQQQPQQLQHRESMLSDPGMPESLQGQRQAAPGRGQEEAPKATLRSIRSQPPPGRPAAEAEPAWGAPPQQGPEGWAAAVPVRPPPTAGPGDGDDDAQWVRMMQQREDDLREAHLRQARGQGPDRSTMYGQAGPFGAAAMVGQIHGSGGSGSFQGHQETGGSVGSGVRRTASHQSMSTLSHAASGALDRSAGSNQSHLDQDQGRQAERNRQMYTGSSWDSA